MAHKLFRTPIAQSTSFFCREWDLIPKLESLITKQEKSCETFCSNATCVNTKSEAMWVIQKHVSKYSLDKIWWFLGYSNGIIPNFYITIFVNGSLLELGLLLDSLHRLVSVNCRFKCFLVASLLVTVNLLLHFRNFCVKRMILGKHV